MSNKRHNIALALRTTLSLHGGQCVARSWEVNSSELSSMSAYHAILTPLLLQFQAILATSPLIDLLTLQIS